MRLSTPILLLLTLFLVNCSEVKFSDKNGATSGSNAPAGDLGKNGDESGGQIAQPSGPEPTAPAPVPAPVPTPPPPAAPMVPRVIFVGPPCVRGTACLVEFRLDQAYALNVDFDWRTDDTLYQQPAPAGTPTIGQPGVHYVATSGHITFPAGETVKKVYIQNINPYNIEIIIGVKMRNCNYGGAVANCSELFR